jgi:hypothetical protein
VEQVEEEKPTIKQHKTLQPQVKQQQAKTLQEQAKENPNKKPEGKPLQNQQAKKKQVKLLQEQQAKEQQAKLLQEQQAKEQQAKLLQEQQAKEQQAKLLQKQHAKEQQAKLLQEQHAKEQQAQLLQEQQAKERQTALTKIDKTLASLALKIIGINTTYCAKAKEKAGDLLIQLRGLRNKYEQALNDPNTSRTKAGIDFKNGCKQAIESAKPLLEKDLSFGDFLDNLFKDLANAVIKIFSDNPNALFKPTRSALVQVAEDAEIELGLTGL